MRALLPLLVLAPSAASQSITVLVQDADVIAGVGNVTSIENLAVNNAGSWIVEADTDNANTNIDGVLMKNGALFIRQGDLVPAVPGAAILSFDAVTLNNNGNSGWNFFLTGVATNLDSGIFFDSTLVIQESAVSTAPQFTAGTPYIGFFETKFNDLNQTLIVASVDDPAIATTVDRAMVVAQTDGAGALLSETVLMKEGDSVIGIPVETVADFGTGPSNFALNNNGVAMFEVDMTGATATDGLIFVGNTMVAREGDPSPIAGRNWEVLLGKAVDLNDAGDYVFTANLDGATIDDELIIKNNSVVIAQEGSGLPAIGTWTFTGFGSGAVRIANTGDVFWTGIWNDPDTTRNAGLFRNGELLVQKGVTMVGGQVITAIATVQDDFAISNNGRYVIFEGQLAGADAAFLLDLGSVPTAFCFGDGSGAACPCTNSGAAGNGCANSLNPAGANLAASGAASIGSDTLVLLGSGMPNSSALYFQGTAQQAGGAGVAFGDGLRCAGGTVVRLGTKTNVGGASQYPVGADLSISVRGGVTAPGTRTYQVWYRNAAAYCTAATFNLSNGVEVPWAL